MFAKWSADKNKINLSIRCQFSCITHLLSTIDRVMIYPSERVYRFTRQPTVGSFCVREDTAHFRYLPDLV